MKKRALLKMLAVLSKKDPRDVVRSLIADPESGWVYATEGHVAVRLLAPEVKTDKVKQLYYIPYAAVKLACDAAGRADADIRIAPGKVGNFDYPEKSCAIDVVKLFKGLKYKKDSGAGFYFVDPDLSKKVIDVFKAIEPESPLEGLEMMQLGRESDRPENRALYLKRWEHDPRLWDGKNAILGEGLIMPIRLP